MPHLTLEYLENIHGQNEILEVIVDLILNINCTAQKMLSLFTR